MKYFRLTWHQVLWELSFANLNMLLATIPVYEPEKDKKKESKEKAGTLKETLTNLFKDE